MRVIFAGGGTGGHLYPGLAIARALKQADPEVEPFFIGARRGIERDVLPQVGFAFELLDLHPLYRSRPWENWKTVRGAMSAWRIIGAEVRSEPPSCVVGTGGCMGSVCNCLLNCACQCRISKKHSGSTAAVLQIGDDFVDV